MVGYPFQPYLAKSDKIDFDRLFQKLSEIG